MGNLINTYLDIKFTRLGFENVMLNRPACLTMSTRILKALPGKLDIERHSPSILYYAVTDEK